MAAGHLVGGSCVAVAASTDLYYSQKPDVYTAGGQGADLWHTFEKIGASWSATEYSVSKTGVISLVHHTPLPVPLLASCVYDDSFTKAGSFNDGMQLGWAVAAAMVVVYVIRRPYR